MRYIGAIAVLVVCLSVCACGGREQTAHSSGFAGRTDAETTLSRGRRAASTVSLKGVWEYARGTGDERAETRDGQRGLPWQRATLPADLDGFLGWNEDDARHLRCVWAKRRFEVSKEQANKMAVLRWNRISLGAEAFINGHKVGEHELTGPYQVILPPDALREGENEIVLRII